MSKCRCPHHSVVGAFVLVFGLMFLLQAMGVLSATFVSYGWPILIMAFGLHKLIEGMCSCCRGKKMMGKGMEMDSGKADGCDGECGCGSNDKGCGGNCACGTGAKGHDHAEHADHK